jgi:hypothetical protein
MGGKVAKSSPDGEYIVVKRDRDHGSVHEIVAGPSSKADAERMADFLNDGSDPLEAVAYEVRKA